MQAQYGCDYDYPSELENDDYFFKKVEEAESAVRPLSFTSLLMQCHKNTLADVAYMFGSLFQSFSKHETHSEHLVEMLEKRWSDQEHPLLLLSFMCRPYMETLSSISKKSNKLDLLHMSHYAILHYKNLLVMISVI